jgi:hypothetical protein
MLCVPVIWMYWLEHQAKLLEEAKVNECSIHGEIKNIVQERGPLTLAGDGRYESPGRCRIVCECLSVCLYVTLFLTRGKAGRDMFFANPIFFSAHQIYFY